MCDIIQFIYVYRKCAKGHSDIKSISGIFFFKKDRRKMLTEGHENISGATPLSYSGDSFRCAYFTQIHQSLLFKYVYWIYLSIAQ